MPREVYKLSPSNDFKELERQLNNMLSRLTTQLQRIEGLDGATPKFYNNIDMSSKKLTSLTTGSADTDSVNKSQVGAGGGASVFTDLTDTPASFSGQATKVVSVNSGETALEFTAAGAGSLNNIVEDTTPQLGGDLDGQDNIIMAIQLQDYYETIGTATVSSGTLTVNAANGNFQKHTMSENVTTIDFTNITASVVTPITLKLTQHASAAKTLDFDTVTAKINGATKTLTFAEGVGPALSSTTSSVNYFSFIIDPADNVLAGFAGGANHA
jgi:hypothetical protein